MKGIQRLFDLFPLIFVAVWMVGIFVTIMAAIRRSHGKKPAEWKLPAGLRMPYPNEVVRPAPAPGESVIAEYGTVQTSFLGLSPAYCNTFLVQSATGRELVFVWPPVSSDSGPSQHRLGYSGCKRLQDILGKNEHDFVTQASLLGYSNPAGPSVSAGMKWLVRTFLRFQIPADFGVIEEAPLRSGTSPGKNPGRSAAAMIWRKGQTLYLTLVFRCRAPASSVVGIHLFGQAGREALRTILTSSLGFDGEDGQRP